MKIKNIEKTAARIKRAITQKEKIVLYGDIDLDGAASVVILQENIEAIGGKVSLTYFSDREKEGYGLNKKALLAIKKKIGDCQFLLITMDCGITNFQEAILAKKMGIELIIIDHHQPHHKLPEAAIIVAPKQTDDWYPFKDLANAGLIFKLAEEILGNDFINFRKGFAELAALATISDMMKEEKDNQEIINEGLDALQATQRLGLQLFREVVPINKEQPIRVVAQKIISLFGVSKIIKNKTEIYLILTSKNEKEIKKLLKELIARNKIKQEKIIQIMEEITKDLELSDKIVFQGKTKWSLSLLGSVASRIENNLKKPVFLYKLGRQNSRGSVRAPSGVNVVDAMKESSDILIAYGGHPPAAGFSIKNENLAEFKKRLENYFKSI